jgi:hypothetical protein
MLEQAFLEGLQAAFWPLYVTCVTASALAFVIRRQWCIGRTVFALVLASLAQTAVESATGAFLPWWGHLIIDGLVLFVITMPPRHYWQATMGGLVFAQIALHIIWFAANIFGDMATTPVLAREHWLAVTLIGFAKCAVLLAWAGGKRVEAVLAGAARFATRLVPAALKGSVA